MQTIAIPINLGTPDSGTIFESLPTDPAKLYTIRVRGTADCQTEQSHGRTDGIWWRIGSGWVLGRDGGEGGRVYLWYRRGSNFGFEHFPTFRRSSRYVVRNIQGTGEPFGFQFNDPDFGNNSGQLYVDIYETGLACSHTGMGSCPVTHSSSGNIRTRYSVSLFTAEKYEEATDITLNTAGGTLSFSRAYGQSKLTDSSFQYMGAGWSHNHAVSLTETPASGTTPGSVIVRLENGTEAFSASRMSWGSSSTLPIRVQMPLLKKIQSLGNTH
jgi:hypothetical protein